MRRALLYLAFLSVAAAAAFFGTYLFGRHPSLEAELELLTSPAYSPSPGKSAGIPSLQRAEIPPEAPVEPQGPGGEPLGAGIVVTRSPLEPAGMMILADLPALALAPGDAAPPFASGLAAFLSRPPAGLQIGLRALAGFADECGSTDALLGLGQVGGGEFARALDPASGQGLGSRNPAGAVEAAAGDLSPVTGEHSVVIVTGGEDECAADLCGDAPPPGGPGQRIHVLLLAPRPRPGSDPWMPDAGSAGTLQAIFEPAWALPYRCLSNRSGGSLETVSSPRELEAALRRLAGTLEASVVVKGFHYTGQEIRGVSPGGAAGWGATLRLGTGARGGVRTIGSDIYPTVFAVPQGVHLVKARYAGQERTAAVAVASGERAELRVTFATGVVYLQAFDTAGGEIVGDSTGFSCAWGADVFPEDGDTTSPVASTCSFPSRLELSPGTYKLRARWRGLERFVAEVIVEAGTSSVHQVSFGVEED